jgi:hypothetical protein
VTEPERTPNLAILATESDAELGPSELLPDPQAVATPNRVLLYNALHE